MDFSSLGVDLPHATLIAAFVLGFTQSLKQVGLPTSVLPLAACVMGAVSAGVLTAFVPLVIFSGAVIGLAVSGVVSLAKGD